MTKKKTRSRVFDEILETAGDLYASGLITKKRMAEFEAICGRDAEALAPREIRRLRRDTHLSQSVFAAVIGTSVSTVQKWEAGDKRPSGPSLKLLNLIARKGLDVVL